MKLAKSTRGVTAALSILAGCGAWSAAIHPANAAPNTVSEGPPMQIAQSGGGATQGSTNAQSGQGASPQGGQGGATQVGTPPEQLKKEEMARRRAEHERAQNKAKSGSGSEGK